MIFEELILHNFATYKGVNTINLLPVSPRQPVILIGGENGCGKTTLLDALQLVLFGTTANCSNRRNVTYDVYLERCINRGTVPGDAASIKLTFQHFSGGESKRYSIERKWFKKKNKIEKQFWAYELNDGEIKFNPTLSEHWEDYVETFFPSEVAPFFFFDGEKIEALADFDTSGTLIHAAIHGLLGLNLVKQLENDLLTLQKRKRKELDIKSENGLVEAIELQLQACRQKISECRTEEAQLNNVRDELLKEAGCLETEFRKQGGELYEKRSDLEEKRRRLQDDLLLQEAELHELSSGATPLLMVGEVLQEIQSQAVLEENAYRNELTCAVLKSRDQAILDLVAQQVGERHAVEKLASFLETDRKNRLATSKVMSYLNLPPDAQKDLESLLRSELPGLQRRVPEVVVRVKCIQEEIDAVELSIASIPDASKISSLLEERARVEAKLASAKISLRVVQEEIERNQRQFEQKSGELKRELTKEAQARFEQKDTRRVIHYAARVRGTLETFESKIIEQHMSRIETLVLEAFKNLLRKKNLVERLVIDRRSYQVRLYSNNGEEMMPDRLSAGERQLLATALLWGICQAAGKPLPTVIDTPLGRLDTSHRTNLIENYFPNAGHQVLLLSTNEEIVGRYLETLRPYISKMWVLKHSESEGGTTIRPGYLN